MKILSNDLAVVKIRPWSDKNTFGYDIFTPNSSTHVLFGLVHTDTPFRISMSDGHVTDIIGVATVANGLSLLTKYFKHQSHNGKIVGPKKRPSLADEMKRRVMNNSLNNSKKRHKN